MEINERYKKDGRYNLTLAIKDMCEEWKVEGHIEGKIHSLLMTLRAMGEVPNGLEAFVRETKDRKMVAGWLGLLLERANRRKGEREKTTSLMLELGEGENIHEETIEWILKAGNVDAYLAKRNDECENKMCQALREMCEDNFKEGFVQGFCEGLRIGGNQDEYL